jgi:5-methylcytosine-specific restriction endonuclease McrA
MPIAPELRHHYQGPVWKQVRAEILERAQHCCEKCGKPNGVEVLATSTAWFDSITVRWIHAGDRLVDLRPPVERGRPCCRPCAPASLKIAQLGVAHINHNSADRRRRNLAAWCRECHLLFDVSKHAQTRAARKDARRPLVAAAIASELCTNQLSLKPSQPG